MHYLFQYYKQIYKKGHTNICICSEVYNIDFSLVTIPEAIEFNEVGEKVILDFPNR